MGKRTSIVFTRFRLKPSRLAFLSLQSVALLAITGIRADEYATPPQRLVPVRERTDEETDQLRAATLVMEARILERRDELVPALRKYQRAWRLDSGHAKVVLKQIVPLALRLGRVAEATRYALLLTNSDLEDPFLAERMAMLMADQLQYDRSLQLYQRVLQLRASSPQSRSPVAMHFEMGRLYFLTKKYEQATQSFRVVLKAIESPDQHGLSNEVKEAILADPSLVYNLIGESFLESGEYAEAAELFKKAAKAKQDSGWLTFQLARVDYRAGRYREAQHKLEDYVNQKLRIGGWTPYRLLQSAMEKTAALNPDGDQPSVLVRFRDWLLNDPENFPLLSFVADLSRRRGGLQDAARFYEKAIASQPTLEAYRGLVATYRQLGNESGLVELLGQIVSQLDSLDPVAGELTDLVDQPELLKALFGAAREQLDDEGPGDRNVAIACCLLAIRAQQYDVADEFLATLEASTSYSLYESYAIQLLVVGEHARAIKHLQTALQSELPPAREAALRYYLAGALQMTGQNGEALQVAYRAAELAPDNPEIALRPAWILYSAGKNAEAEPKYVTWLEKHAEDYSIVGLRESVQDARFVMSNICLDDQRIDEAAEWLEQILDEFPRHIGALNDLGYLLVDQGKSLSRATRMIRLAIDAEPDNVAYRDSLGWALFQLGKFDDAVAELRKAASEDTPDPIILDHLGDALWAAGDREAAGKVWQQALAQLLTDAPDDQLVLQIQQKLKQE